jgi:DNA-binding NarL/FixJ family response regulator
MEPCRILLANVPRFLRQILKQSLEKDPGLEIVGEVLDSCDLPQAVEQTRAQWIIVPLSADGELAPPVEQLLTTHPTVRLLALTTDGSHIKAKWIEPREKTLDGLSLDELRAILHEA